MRLALRPAQTSDGRPVIDFRLDAERWALPFGPKVKWSEVRANGRIDGKLIEVSSYSLAGFYGVISGMLYAASDVEWVITGRATGTNIDIETDRPASCARRRRAGARPFADAGHGGARLSPSSDAASPLTRRFEQAVVAGPFQVRWAALNGINLGPGGDAGRDRGRP